MSGSDMHQISGYIPAMRSGDVIGHAFLGEIVEVGPAVSRRSETGRSSARSPAAGTQYCK